MARQTLNDANSALASQVTDALETAAQLAAYDALSTVEVLCPRRPTYQEMLRYQHVAMANGLDLELTRDVLIIRARAGSSAVQSGSPDRREPLQRLRQLLAHITH